MDFKDETVREGKRGWKDNRTGGWWERDPSVSHMYAEPTAGGTHMQILQSHKAKNKRRCKSKVHLEKKKC